MVVPLYSGPKMMFKEECEAPRIMRWPGAGMLKHTFAYRKEILPCIEF
jgi:hypothetical protein